MGFLGVIGSVVGGALGGPVGSAIGGALGGAIDGDKASRDAQGSINRATDASIAEQRRQFDLTREDFAPYREAGQNALGQLVGQMNRMPTAREVMSDPGYRFGLQQGQQGIDRKIASMGGRVSGAAIKAASRFNTDYASSGYGAAYQRRQDRLNRLAAIAGIGQTATGSSAIAGQNMANSVSGAMMNRGDANAAAQMQRGTVWGNAGNQIAALYQNKPGNSMQAAFSQTPIGSSGFGSGMAYGNQDLGQYF